MAVGQTVHLDAHLSSVARARRFVRDTLDALPPPVVADLMLATSELVTNAIEHARTVPGVDVTVGVDAGAAYVTVRSTGDHTGLAEAELWAMSPPEGLTGRGLGIVRQIADHVAVVRSRDTVEITIRRSYD